MIRKDEQKEAEKSIANSCFTSTEFSCRRSSAICLRLLDKRIFDNLLHSRAIRASTIYIQSSLLGVQSCHAAHAGIIA